MDYRLIQSDSNPKFKRWRKLAENARFIKKEKASKDYCLNKILQYGTKYDWYKVAEYCSCLLYTSPSPRDA